MPVEKTGLFCGILALSGINSQPLSRRTELCRYRPGDGARHRPAWYAFPQTNGVRTTETIVNNIARVVEGNATPDVALAKMATGVRRRLPR